MQRLHIYASLTAAATFALIFAGGLVTSTGSGLAVPDWPLSFGQFFPRMQGGVLFEHGHRMIAGSVALLTFGLSAWVLKVETRTGVRRLGIAASLLVLIQALLGGATVLLRLPVMVSASHALTAQAFMCCVVALALTTGRSWRSFECAPRDAEAELKPVRLRRWALLSALTCLAIYLQIGLGALVRHTGAGFAIPDFPLAYGRIIPPFSTSLVLLHFLHRALAFALAVWVSALGWRIRAHWRRVPYIKTPALALTFLVWLQILAGGVTIWSDLAVIPSTFHLLMGALILAASLVLTLRLYQLKRLYPLSPA